MVNALSLRLSRRELRHHPQQMLLMLISIAIGVAIVVAVDLANSSARKAFQLSMDMTFGSATHSITAGDNGVPEEIYTQLRTQFGLRNSAPLLNAEIKVNDRLITLIGVDPFASSFYPVLENNALSFDATTQLFSQPLTGVISNRTANDLGIGVGKSLTGSYQNSSFELIIIDVLAHTSEHDQNYVIVDIATAQQVLGKQGVLDRIDLQLQTDEIKIVESLLPVNHRLITTERERNSSQQMTAAFHTNLAAMSLLALLVGIFLVYNSVTFSALRRRQQFGILRALGLSKSELFNSIILETVIIAVMATILGLLLGVFLAQFLLQLVTLTINDLYYRLEVSQLHISYFPLLKGFLLGTLFSAMAAIFPAIEATRVTPISLQNRMSLEEKTVAFILQLLFLGLALILIGLTAIIFAPQNILYGFIALALVIIGFSIAVPYLLEKLSTTLSKAGRGNHSFITQLCLRGVSHNLSRVSAAVTALSLAVATTIGVGLMIGSFRIAVSDWLDESLPGDLYISVPSSSENGQSTFLPDDLIRQLKGHPMVDTSWQARFTKTDSSFGPVSLLATERKNIEQRGFKFVDGERDKAMSAFKMSHGAFISEPFANHNRIAKGDIFKISTATGMQEITVLGIFYDYSSDRGLIVLPLATFQDWWQDSGISSLGLIRSTAYAPDAFRTEIQTLVEAENASFRLRSNVEIKTLSLAIFDRTFTVTEVLRVLAVVVAFIGILSSLLAVQIERRREFALLRACGCTPREIVTLVIGQTFLLGVCAAIFAIPLGIVMSNLLIHVINVRSFGWSMPHLYQLEPLVGGILLSISAALLAGLYPALRATKTNTAQTLRQE